MQNRSTRQRVSRMDRSTAFSTTLATLPTSTYPALAVLSMMHYINHDITTAFGTHTIFEECASHMGFRDKGHPSARSRSDSLKFLTRTAAGVTVLTHQIQKLVSHYLTACTHALSQHYRGHAQENTHWLSLHHPNILSVLHASLSLPLEHELAPSSPEIILLAAHLCALLRSTERKPDAQIVGELGLDLATKFSPHLPEGALEHAMGMCSLGLCKNDCEQRNTGAGVKMACKTLMCGVRANCPYLYGSALLMVARIRDMFKVTTVELNKALRDELDRDGSLSTDVHMMVHLADRSEIIEKPIGPPQPPAQLLKLAIERCSLPLADLITHAIDHVTPFCSHVNVEQPTRNLLGDLHLYRARVCSRSPTSDASVVADLEAARQIFSRGSDYLGMAEVQDELADVKWTRLASFATPDQGYHTIEAHLRRAISLYSHCGLHSPHGNAQRRLGHMLLQSAAHRFQHGGDPMGVMELCLNARHHLFQALALMTQANRPYGVGTVARVLADVYKLMARLTQSETERFSHERERLVFLRVAFAKLSTELSAGSWMLAIQVAMSIVKTMQVDAVQRNAASTAPEDRELRRMVAEIKQALQSARALLDRVRVSVDSQVSSVEFSRLEGVVNEVTVLCHPLLTQHEARVRGAVQCSGRGRSISL